MKTFLLLLGIALILSGCANDTSNLICCPYAGGTSCSDRELYQDWRKTHCEYAPSPSAQITMPTEVRDAMEEALSNLPPPSHGTPAEQTGLDLTEFCVNDPRLCGDSHDPFVPIPNHD